MPASNRQHAFAQLAASLHCHPAQPCNSEVAGLDVQLQASAEEICVGYTLRADTRQLLLPEWAEMHRADRLWEHSCFELFIRQAGQAGYTEFNFSPSGAWAVYGFGDYRQPLPPAAAPVMPQIHCSRNASQLALQARISAVNLPGYAASSLLVAIAAVLETRAGALSWWALRHPQAKPDFHHPQSFLPIKKPPLGGAVGSQLRF